MSDDDKVAADSDDLLRPGEGPKKGKLAVLDPTKVRGADIVKIWLEQLQADIDAEEEAKK